MSGYDAKSRVDIMRLAEALLAAPLAARPALAACLAANGLMLPTQWWVRFAVWLAKKRHGVDDFMVEHDTDGGDEALDPITDYVAQRG